MKYEKGSFVTVPNKKALSGIGVGPQALYLWLCDFANTEGDCFPARSTLANRIGCSTRAIDSYLKVLESVGLVEKENRFKDNEKISNNYYLPLIRGAKSALPRAKSALPPRAESAHRTQTTLSNSNHNDFSKEKSSLSEKNSSQSVELRDVDSDGTPLPPRRNGGAQSQKQNAEAVALRDKCVRLIGKGLGIEPIFGMKEYIAVKRALQHIKPSQIIQMVEDAIADGRAEKSGMSLNAILSDNQINKFRLEN